VWASGCGDFGGGVGCLLGAAFALGEEVMFVYGVGFFLWVGGIRRDLFKHGGLVGFTGLDIYDTALDT
jgi:hypothetical protein